VVIDYEFCSYNYRAFDIANHLCEWMFEYNSKVWPFYHCEKDKFPTKERQVKGVLGLNFVLVS
jgi:choline/ethanolamine kinase